MRTSKIFRRTRKLIVVASFGLLLFGAINHPTMTAYASEAGQESQLRNSLYSRVIDGKAQAIPGELEPRMAVAI